MKVLIMMNSTDVKLGGGIIQIILNYKNQFKDYNDIFFTYAINCIDNSIIPELFTEDNSEFIRIPNKKKSMFKYISFLNNLMKKNNYDVIHVHGNSSNMIIELLIAKFNKIPKRIAHCHNSTCSHPFFNKLINPLFKTTYTDALACSKVAGEWLFKKDFSVINNAIDIDSFCFSYDMRKKLRKKIKVNDETKVIGHVGNLNEQKNQEFIINLFKIYHQKNNNSKLLLIGDGSLKSKLLNQVEKLNLKENVIFLGTQTNVNEWMQAMDLFIFPSKWEGFGMAALEAQASGLPVICSENVPKEIKISKNVSFVKLDSPTENWVNEIEKLLKNNNRIIKKEDFNDYNITIQKNNLLKIYCT